VETANGHPRVGPNLPGRPTYQRATVLRALVDTGDFVSAQVLHARLITNGTRVGLSTVYRTLTALAEAGHADTMREPDGERLFRYRTTTGHRHYLLCRTCGRSQPIDSETVETWADTVAQATGFTAVHHTLELTGICANCTAAT
jgi:Fur family transcriptional regulator, ferric uptake regulator